MGLFLGSLNLKSVLVNLSGDARQIASFYLAHEDDLLSAAHRLRLHHIDDFSDNFGANVGFCEDRRVFNCVLHKGRSVDDSATAAIQHFEFRCKLLEHALLDLVEFLQFFLEFMGNVLLNVAKLGRVQQNLLTTPTPSVTQRLT